MSKFGQLGQGTLEDSLSPAIVEALKGKRIVSVACGEHHSLAIAGAFSYLLPGYAFSLVSTKRTTSYMTSFLLCCASFCWLASLIRVIAELGDLYVWGRGREGQLGNGEKQAAATPIPVHVRTFIQNSSCYSSDHLSLSLPPSLSLRLSPSLSPGTCTRACCKGSLWKLSLRGDNRCLPCSLPHPLSSLSRLLLAL